MLQSSNCSNLSHSPASFSIFSILRAEQRAETQLSFLPKTSYINGHHLAVSDNLPPCNVDILNIAAFDCVH